jgi:pimeloyl-ACP methyl ester carboxylesterase
MDITKRKEVEINNNIFSYIFLEGQNKEKNIFFFHATGFNAETYIPFFLKLNELLENQYSIYALDQRGHGLSERFRSSIRINFLEYLFFRWKKFS